MVQNRHKCCKMRARAWSAVVARMRGGRGAPQGQWIARPIVGCACDVPHPAEGRSEWSWRISGPRVLQMHAGARALAHRT